MLQGDKIQVLRFSAVRSSPFPSELPIPDFLFSLLQTLPHHPQQQTHLSLQIVA